MKRLRILLLTLVIQGWVCMVCGWASHDQYAPGARSAGMAGMGVMLPGFWSMHNNQAGLASIDQVCVGFHHENRFLESKLGLQSLALALPAKPGTLALNMSGFGYSIYRESRIGLAFARKFTERFAAGIQLDYFHTHISGKYGHKSFLGVEAGIQYRPSSRLIAGAHVFNPTRTRINTYPDEYLPTIFRAGMAWTAGEELLIGIEIEKDLEKRPIWKAGMEYTLSEQIWIRAGTGISPASWCFGLGYRTGRVRTDLAFTYHHVLGTTPHFSIQISFP